MLLFESIDVQNYTTLLKDGRAINGTRSVDGGDDENNY